MSMGIMDTKFQSEYSKRIGQDVKSTDDYARISPFIALGKQADDCTLLITVQRYEVPIKKDHQPGSPVDYVRVIHKIDVQQYNRGTGDAEPFMCGGCLSVRRMAPTVTAVGILEPKCPHCGYSMRRVTDEIVAQAWGLKTQAAQLPDSDQEAGSGSVAGVDAAGNASAGQTGKAGSAADNAGAD